MDVATAAARTRDFFVTNAAAWRLEPDRVRVDYVPGPGGFGPMSFSVTDGTRAYHVKLRRDARALDAWAAANELLVSRYRAPRLLERIAVGDRHGAVFSRVAGAAPERGLDDATLRGLVALLDRLHADEDVAAAIGGGDAEARRAFTDYYEAILNGDIEELRANGVPPFIDELTMEWMAEETGALVARAHDSAAFDEAVRAPIHNDLWFGNVLVGEDGWSVIDWDGLAIGDPAHDLALATFTDPRARAHAGTRDAAFDERFDLYVRGAWLSFVVDPLTDWMVAAEFPAVRDEARAHREALYRWALDAYRARYCAT